ncbi:dapper homolog 3-like [Oncorhynchus clarkii lewisi]|uniref:dapper homolog 3-like n=1 Tax=Oncorhynchus clarkii lewisi TaxID=490388 RepID=UPI0039B90EEA
MYGAFSFPMTAERRRNKERLEASLAGICELELLKQSQECLVLSALSIRDSVPGRPAWGNLQPTRSSPDTANCALEDLSYRRKPSSLQCSPWGLMASLEQQVGELRVNTADNAVESPTDMVDNRPRSGFYELSEHLSPMGLSDSYGFREPSPSTARAIRMVYANNRPKSAGEFFGANRDRQPESGSRPTVPRSFSAPYPTLEGIAEGASEGEGEDEAWPWDTSKGPGGVLELGGDMVEGEPTEEDYRQAQRVETYILGLIQRRALPLRPCKPRTSLGLHEARTAITVARQSSVCRKEPDPRPATDSIPDHHSHSNPHHATAAVSPSSYERPPPSWACRSLDQEPFAVMALVPEDPPHHHHQHPHPHYPQSRQTPLANTCSASLDYPCGEAPSQEPSSSEPDSPQQFHNGYPALPPSRSPPPPDEQLVNAQYIPAQPFRATTTRASAHSHKGPKPSRGTYYPERGSQQQPAPQQLQQAKSRAAAKKCRFSEEREREREKEREKERDRESERDREREMERPGGSKKPGRRACRSQSENSLNGQRGVPERKYNTVERDGGGSGSSRGSQSKGKRPQPGSAGYRRWRSTLDLSQDEAEQPPQPTPMPPADHGSRRIRKPRPPPYTYVNPLPHHHPHHPHLEYLDRDRTYLCRPEEGYTHPGQGESESSLSEADTPASSSLSSDSDESGGLVWPQQLPPQLSSPTLPSAPAGAPLQPKAFVKIKASHALKKKILRFRTGSLKIMTTV